MRERLAAYAAGVLFGGGGGTAVFLTDNQAGSTALILVSAIFFLIGIQGTPITRASKDSIELADRAQEVTAKAKEIAEGDDPEQALSFIEGAISAQPELNSIPSVQAINLALLFEVRVRHAIERIGVVRGFRIAAEQLDRRHGASDCVISYPRNSRQDVDTINVTIKYSINKNPSATQFERMLNTIPSGRFLPTIFVSNIIIPAAAESALKEKSDDGVFFVPWFSELDDNNLDSAISRLTKDEPTRPD